LILPKYEARFGAQRW